MTPFAWLWPLLVVLAGTIVVLRSSWFKGWLGEIVVRLACRFLDRKIYHVAHNVTLPLPERGTTQIDHLIISRFGIFVVETKNFRGAIYGSEHDRTWTQVIGGRKIVFSNPLRQNYGHARAVAELLGIPYGAVQPIVMFIGSARIKTKNKLPANVLTHGLLSYIRSHREPVHSDGEVANFVKIVAEKRLPPTFATRRRHLRNIRAGANRTAGKKRR